MTISSISSSGQSQSIQQAGSRGTLTQEDFLNLVITQLRNQDPLQPMSSGEMASQMTQFGILDSVNVMNENMEGMLAYQASMYNLTVSNLIGKKVETVGNSLTIEEGAVSKASYQLSQPGNVTIQIYDDNGNLVRTIEDGTKDTSKQTLVWDGNNQQGVKCPNGNYTFKITAVDDKRQSISTTSYRIGTIKGISFKNGITYLDLGSVEITMNQIIAILG
jgi:flagellar basal-body rod modification protein FlgD